MKRILAVITAIACAACLFAGCQPADPSAGNEGGGTENPYAQATNLVEDGYYYMGDFETLEQCMQLKLTSNFGKTSLNTDKTYVTHGEGSLKMEILGKEEAWGKARPGVTVSCSGAYFQKTDFSDCSAICFDLYNTLDREVNVDLRPYPLWETSFTIWMEPGWNHVEFSTENFFYPHNNEFYDDEINQFSLVFPRGDGVTLSVFYLDNFRAKLK